jgi:hypothetical protein
LAIKLHTPPPNARLAPRRHDQPPGTAATSRAAPSGGRTATLTERWNWAQVDRREAAQRATDDMARFITLAASLAAAVAAQGVSSFAARHRSCFAGR